jgi:hypothetical protein
VSQPHYALSALPFLRVRIPDVCAGTGIMMPVPANTCPSIQEAPAGSAPAKADSRILNHILALRHITNSSYFRMPAMLAIRLPRAQSGAAWAPARQRKSPAQPRAAPARRPGPPTATQHCGPASVVTGMEQYLGTLADMHRRELITDSRRGRGDGSVRRGRKTRDPLQGVPRARMMWWAAVAGLRRATIGTARGTR